MQKLVTIMGLLAISLSVTVIPSVGLSNANTSQCANLFNSEWQQLSQPVQQLLNEDNRLYNKWISVKNGTDIRSKRVYFEYYKSVQGWESGSKYANHQFKYYKQYSSGTKEALREFLSSGDKQFDIEQIKDLPTIERIYSLFDASLRRLKLLTDAASEIKTSMEKDRKLLRELEEKLKGFSSYKILLSKSEKSQANDLQRQIEALMMTYRNKERIYHDLSDHFYFRFDTSPGNYFSAIDDLLGRQALKIWDQSMQELLSLVPDVQSGRIKIKSGKSETLFPTNLNSFDSIERNLYNNFESRKSVLNTEIKNFENNEIDFLIRIYKGTHTTHRLVDMQVSDGSSSMLSMVAGGMYMGSSSSYSDEYEEDTQHVYSYYRFTVHLDKTTGTYSIVAK